MGSSKKGQKETNPNVLMQALLRRLPRRISGRGQIVFPAVPALLEHYTQNLINTFAALGRLFTSEERNNLRDILKMKLEESFAASPHGKVIIDYYTDEPPSLLLSYTISHAVISIADEYAGWLQTRTPPLFGAHPDAKVMELAHSLGTPAEVAVLDVGAGTGRNTLPLAEAGFRTDAVELAPSLASVLRKDLAARGVSAKVFEGDALDPTLGIPEQTYDLVLLAEVVASHFRSVAQVRRLFEAAARWLKPGGRLVLSAFLSGSGYKPELAVRQFGETAWTCVFTRADMATAIEGLPLTQLSDESTYDYEHEHLPANAWPPTGWFGEWTHGQDVFDLPEDKVPVELRWLVFRRD